MRFNKKIILSHTGQQGQAVVEMCVCVVAVLVVFLGLIYVGGLGLSNIQRLLKAKTNAETSTKGKDNVGDSEDMFAWDYRNQQRQQRQTFEPDAFQGSHLFSPNRNGGISGLPSTGNDRIINKTAGNASQDSSLFQSDFQSTFLRELIPASQIKRNDSAANSVFRNIPPLFVGAEETASPQEADESASDSRRENQGDSLIKASRKDASGAAVGKPDDQNSAELLRGQPSSKRVKKNSSKAVVKP